ncbi:hypothetical protein BH23ACT6_BH23ACT6_21900 [soil metagenome]
MRSGSSHADDVLPLEELINPIAEVELRAVLGSDEVETYTVKTAGVSAQSV